MVCTRLNLVTNEAARSRQPSLPLQSTHLPRGQVGKWLLWWVLAQKGWYGEGEDDGETWCQGDPKSLGFCL